MKVMYDYQTFMMQDYGGVSRYFCEIGRILGGNHNFEAIYNAPIYVNNYLNEYIEKKHIYG